MSSNRPTPRPTLTSLLAAAADEIALGRAKTATAALQQAGERLGDPDAGRRVARGFDSRLTGQDAHNALMVAWKASRQAVAA